MKPVLSAGMTLMAMSVAIPVCRAQCDFDQMFDHVRVTRAGTTVDVDPERLNVYFGFIMKDDSTASRYLITEMCRNGGRLKLLGWCNDSVRIGWTNAELSDTSRTETFLLSDGDTLSFYREFHWLNPVNGMWQRRDFYSADTLTYSVELVERNGHRLALLDSMGVMARTTRGSPVFHGTRPPTAIVAWSVPPSLHGKTAFMRIRVESRGGGGHYFQREDKWGIGISRRVADPAWERLVTGIGKPAADDRTTPAHTGAQLSVAPNPTTGHVDITFDGTVDAKETTIAIFDAKGRLLFCPLRTTGPFPASRVSYDFHESGSYHVALIRDGRLERSIPVTIIK